jgi:two-component system sensor histidine kinase BarA
MGPSGSVNYDEASFYQNKTMNNKEMNTNPAIDTALAIEQAGGNEELARELLGMLLNELPQLRDMLAQAIQHSQMDAIWDHAHKIHGSTAYCGVPALRDSFKALESAIREQNIEAIARQFKIADLEIERLLTSGHDYLHKPW